MNINELKNMIDEKVDRDRSEKLKAEVRENIKIKNLMNSIKALQPRIANLLELREYAEDNGIELTPSDISFRDDEDDFYTNGISHRVGFFRQATCSRRSNNFRKVEGIGIENGGANGEHHLLITINGDVIEFEERKIYDGARTTYEYPTIKPNIKDMEKFLNNFDEFETRLIEYIKSVCKKDGE